MQKKTAISLALMAVLAIGAGCNQEPVAQAPVQKTETTENPSENVSAKITSETVMAEDIAARLTSAGYTYTTKDGTANLASMKTKDVITASKTFVVTAKTETVKIDVFQLSNTEKSSDVKAEIENEWKIVQKYDESAEMDFLEVTPMNLVVAMRYTENSEMLAKKVKKAIVK